MLLVCGIFRKDTLNVILEEDGGHCQRDPLHKADEVAPLILRRCERERGE